MEGRDQGLAAGFPVIDEAAWRQRVEAELGQGAAADLARRLRSGIVIEPLYGCRAGLDDPVGFAGVFPFTRGGDRGGGAGWQITAALPAGDVESVAEAAVEAAAGGADALLLSVDAAGRRGVPVDDLSTFEQVLAGLDLGRLALHLEGPEVGPALAPALVALCRRRGIDPASLRGSVADDPVTEWARTGMAPENPTHRYRWLARAGQALAGLAPGMRTLVISGHPFREAGAHGVRELSLMLAAAAELLRGIQPLGGATADRAWLFVTGIGREIFAEIARLRALRACWSRMARAAGLSAGASPAIAARSLLRRRSGRDPWTNLLRGTQETFIAAVGGAEWITVLPYDAACAVPGAQGRRLARNTQLIVRDESHLGRLIDPGGGSGVIEALTRSQAEAAWKGLQAIEAGGGLWARIASGQVQREIENDAAEAARLVATGKMPVTGVSTYPLLDEPQPAPGDRGRPAERRAASPARGGQELLGRIAEQVRRDENRELFEQAIAALEAGAGLRELARALAAGSVASGEPLEVVFEAGAFEALRERADRLSRERDERPRVFLAALGALREVFAQLGWVRNFLAAGGLEVSGGTPAPTVAAAVEAYARSAESVVVACIAPSRREAEGPELVGALRQAGAEHVLLAGRPESGVADPGGATADGWVFEGCDGPAVLAAIIDRLEGQR